MDDRGQRSIPLSLLEWEQPINEDGDILRPKQGAQAGHAAGGEAEIPQAVEENRRGSSPGALARFRRADHCDGAPKERRAGSDQVQQLRTEPAGNLRQDALLPAQAVARRVSTRLDVSGRMGRKPGGAASGRATTGCTPDEQQASRVSRCSAAGLSG